MTTRLLSFVTAATLMAAAAGCTEGSKVKTVPVTAKVTFEGAPLEGATVSFLFEAAAAQTETKHTAFGTTDAQGVCKLTTMETPTKMYEGVVPGKYSVIVTKSDDSSGPLAMIQKMDPTHKTELSDEDREKVSYAHASESGGSNDASEAAKAAAPKALLPAKYANPAESGLTAEVKDGGPQAFDFPLTKE
ncbi:MAG TPA: hypothetical protein VNH11_09865 [Pirellulales bacterium]|nr:hypothetical protein [Pirellulales bacterium]